MKITPDQLDAMHTLEQAATVGPWNVVVKGNSIQSQAIPGVCSGISPKTGNADFIGFSRWFVPRAIEHIRFTEASTEEALLILDDALQSRGFLTDTQLLMAIDMATQKLRPVPAPVHDEAALAQLAEKYPIDLPWMSADSINAVRSSQGYSPLGPPTECQQTNCAMCRKPEPEVAQGLPVEQPAVDVVLSKRALKALTFGQRVELSDAVGVHFALLEAVLQQPKATQGTFTAAKFAELMETAAQRYDVVAEMLKGGTAL